MLPGSLQAETIYSPRWHPNTPASNASIPIVVEDGAQNAVTDSFRTDTSPGVYVGFSTHAGGYIPQMDVDDSDGITDDVVAEKFGRGIQNAFRSTMHCGRSNPTQAGFRDQHGTAGITLHIENRRAVIPKFHTPLFSDPILDFTDAEDLGYDRFPDDGGNSDTDAYTEPNGFTQDWEVRSEFDFGQTMEDVSYRVVGGIPALRSRSYSVWAGDPAQLLQFNQNTLDKNGKNIWREEKRIQDMDQDFPGNQTATDTDLSLVMDGLLTARWRTLEWPFFYAFVRENNAWATYDQRAGDKLFYYMDVDTSYKNTSGEVLYTRDRVLRYMMEAQYKANTNPPFVIMRLLRASSGLLNPSNAGAITPNAIESICRESYLLFGTPNEILAAVEDMENNKAHYSALEPFTNAYNDIPGKIESEDFDSGGHEVAFFDTTLWNTGDNSTYRSGSVDLDSISGGGVSVTDLTSAEWLAYTTKVASAGSHDIYVRYASTIARTIDVKIGALLLDDISLPSTGSMSTYSILKIGSLNLAAGVQQMRTSVSGANINLDYVNVNATSGNNPPRFIMNAGLNDAWFDPLTDGQGFFITIFADLGFVSLAWFTYDTELPPLEATANLGDPGHRWLTAGGLFADNQAVMNIEFTSGGIFDTSTQILRTDPVGSDGTLILTFKDCQSGTVEYDIRSINANGTVPIQR